jgi:MFS family permease
MQLKDSPSEIPDVKPAVRRTFAAAWAATFLINIAWGGIFPLLNVYIHDRGISLVLIGTLSTAGSVVFSLAGVTIGRLSDRLGNRRDLAVVMLVVGAASMLAYLLAQQFLQFMLLGIVSMAMIGGYTVLIDAVVTSVLPEAQRGGSFGWYRISGSLGFAMAGSALGLITGGLGLTAIFVIAAVAHVVAAAAALLMREPPPLLASASHAPAARPPGLWSTLLISGLLWLMIADVIAVFGSQLAYPFLNIYLADHLRATAGDLGWLSTVSVLAEMPAMIGLGRLSDHAGRGIILALGFGSIALSWLLVYLAPGLWLIYLSRPLVGIGIVRYSVGVALISDRVPYEQRATLLGISNVTFGAGGLIAPSVGGFLAQTMGIQPVFLVAFVVSLLATLLYLRTMQLGQPVMSKNVPAATARADG